MNISPHAAFSFVTGISALLLVFNILLSLYQIQTYNKIYYQDYYGISDDDPNLQRLPGRFSTVSMTAARNYQYSLIDDDAWAGVLPDDRGFVRLGKRGRAFELAIYHQIHCINAIRFSYTVARDGLITDTAALKEKLGHDNHCFQWIRQSIQCRADSSLVPFSSQNTSLGEAGFGITHRCRDWAQIKRFVQKQEERWKGIPYI